MTTELETPPLANGLIIAVRQNIYQAAPEAPRQPGGSCWHCGMAIMNEVVVKHAEHGTITVGTTCAERVGLDAKALKEMLAEKFAEDRRLRSAAARSERQAAWLARDAAETAEFGEHGTESRYLSGCLCEPCIEAAPHGTGHLFQWGDGCTCPVCVEWAMATHDSYVLQERDVLVDLATGLTLDDARQVDTRYGMKWRSDAIDVWAPVDPARRATNAKRGVIEAQAVFLVDEIRTRRGGIWMKPIARLTDPIIDNYETPIERAEVTS